MMDLPGIMQASNLDAEAKDALSECIDVSKAVALRNARLTRYYEGDFEPAPIGVDDLPENVKPKEKCLWPRKAVTSVSERCRLAGFSFGGDYRDGRFDDACRASSLVGAFNRNVASVLVHGCMFATVNRTRSGDASSVFHTAETASATWDSAASRIGAGLVVAQTARTPWSNRCRQPVLANLHLPGRVVVFERTGPVSWRASSADTAFDEPMMVPFAWRATGTKPFGDTRITGEVMTIADDVVRIRQNMVVSSEFYSHPQKFALGLTDEMFDMLKKSKAAHAVSSMFLSTMGKKGEVPTYGQLPAVSPQPYIDLIKAYAGLFSASTGVPLNSLGIVQDNPSSADAIQAAREDISLCAEDLIESSREALTKVALMAMAVAHNVMPADLTDEQRSVVPRFGDPVRPSMASRTDAAMKVASVVPEYARTTEFWRDLGKSEADAADMVSEIRRIQALGYTASLLNASERGTDAGTGRAPDRAD